MSPRHSKESRKNPSKAKAKANKIRPKEQITVIRLSLERCVAFMNHDKWLAASQTSFRATGGQ